MTTIVTVHHHYEFGRAGFESSQQTRMNLAKMNGFDYVHLITSPQLVGYEECFRSIGFDYGSIYALDEVFMGVNAMKIDKWHYQYIRDGSVVGEARYDTDCTVAPVPMWIYNVDEQGNELISFDSELRGPKDIKDYVFTGRTDSNEAGDVLTHVYRKVVVESKIPGDAPQYDIPDLKVTRHVNESGKELIDTEKGTQPPRKTIGDHEYTGRTTEKDGITTHVYTPIKHEIPGDAPQVDVPELKVTRYVNEKGEEIKESEAGFINAPKTIGEYEFTGKTELNDGKDVQTHIYKLVEKPVTPTPDPKKPETPSPRTPEPKKPEAPQPEAPKPIETPKSNDSVVESVDQPQFVKNELPKTGETNSNLALIGVSLLTALGLVGFAKRKRED